MNSKTRDERGRETVERMIQNGKEFAEKQGNSVTEAEVRQHVTGIAEQAERKLKEKGYGTKTRN